MYIIFHFLYNVQYIVHPLAASECQTILPPPTAFLPVKAKNRKGPQLFVVVLFVTFLLPLQLRQRQWLPPFHLSSSFYSQARLHSLLGGRGSVDPSHTTAEKSDILLFHCSKVRHLLLSFFTLLLRCVVGPRLANGPLKYISYTL
jgi:hypothetical protein